MQAPYLLNHWSNTVNISHRFDSVSSLHSMDAEEGFDHTKGENFRPTRVYPLDFSLVVCTVESLIWFIAFLDIDLYVLGDVASKS